MDIIKDIDLNYIDEEYIYDQVQGYEEVVEDKEEIVNDKEDVIINNDQDGNVSENEILNVLLRMEEEIKDVQRSNEGILQKSSNTIIYSSISDNNVSNDNIEYVVSDNIMEKPIKDYNVSQSLGFIGIVMSLVVGLVIIIHKGVYRWN